MKEENISAIFNSSVAALDNFCDQGEHSSSVGANQELVRLTEILNVVEVLLSRHGKINILEIGIGFSLVTSALRSVFKSDVLEINAIEHPDVPLLSRDDFMNHLN
jgi:hypothetical protein